MAQFARPDSNITVSNMIEFRDSYTLIDESTPSDADSVASTNNTTAEFECGLSNVTDPGSVAGTVRFRYAKTNAGTPDSGGNDSTITVRLMQGTTQINTITWQQVASSATWALREFTVSSTMMDSITDFTDLRLEFVIVGGGGGPSARRGAAISWAEFELPDAPSSDVTLTPTPVLMDLAVPAPTVGLGALTLSPASVLLDLGVPAPTLGLSLSLTGTPVPLDLAVPAPTLGLSLALAPAAVPVDLGVPGATADTISDIELTPGPVALLLAVPAPTLAQQLSLAPAPVALGTAVPASTVGVGALTLAPAAVLVDLGVPASSVSIGAAPIELTPTPVALLLSVPSPTLGLGAVTLSPSSVVLDLSISPPTISTSLSIAVDPVLVVLGVPGGLAFESGVPIELAPGAVGLDWGWSWRCRPGLLG